MLMRQHQQNIKVSQMSLPHCRNEFKSFPPTAHTRFHRVAQENWGRDYLHRLRGYGLGITSTPAPDAIDGLVVPITFSTNDLSNQCAVNYTATYPDLIACTNVALAGVKL